MPSACAQCDDSSTSPEINVGEVVSHFVWPIATIVAIAEAKHSANSLSPTFHFVVIKDCANLLTAH
jgi:hypothetical protein